MTAISQIRTPSALSLSDLNTTIDHEPRVLDLALAERLGMTDPHAIRRMIEKNRTELESHGPISDRQSENTGRGRPGREYYLNEGQALVICALSRTANAAAVRHALITVYMEYRRGQSGQPIPQLPPPSAAEPPFCPGCLPRQQWMDGERKYLALADGPITGHETLLIVNWRAERKKLEVAIRKQVVAEASAAVRAILTGDVK